ncbi:SDR family NAD(P)-dependent oxidoreductase [Actinokineospora sp. NPDC004072]
MTRSFADKVAVVTGAASGIGAALTRRLLAEGARVAASDIDELPETGAHRYRLDVSDRDAIYAHAAEVAAEFGRVDLVVNNAGVALKGTVAQMSDEELRWIMDINFWGVVHGTRAFLPHVLAARGSIVNISSAFGLIAVPSQSAYNASKFAVRGFTEALRQELLGTGVGVTCVHPGGIKTNIARKGRTSLAEEKADFNRALDKIAMTTPDAAARTILNAARRDRARVLVGPDAYVIDLLPRLLGSFYQPLVTKFFRARS